MLKILLSAINKLYYHQHKSNWTNNISRPNHWLLPKGRPTSTIMETKTKVPQAFKYAFSLKRYMTFSIRSSIYHVLRESHLQHDCDKISINSPATKNSKVQEEIKLELHHNSGANERRWLFWTGTSLKNTCRVQDCFYPKLTYCFFI